MRSDSYGTVSLACSHPIEWNGLAMTDETVGCGTDRMP